MITLQELFESRVASVLGFTLLHFLWQATLIWAVMNLWLFLHRSSSAATRYGLCTFALVLMTLAPVVTFVLLWSAPETVRAVGFALDYALLPGDTTDGRWMDRLAPLVPLVNGVWASGCALFLARSVWMWCRAQWLSRRDVQPVSQEWTAVAAELAGRLGLRRPITVLASKRAGVPMLIGWLRPAILLPVAVLSGLPPEQLRTVIAHELAHVRRHDYLVSLAQTLFESVFFFHPCAWWLSRRLRIEREYCCDDEVVAICGNALGYARALSTLEDMRAGEHQPALASTGGSLMNRITRLVGAESRPEGGAGGWLAPLMALALLIAGGSLLQAADGDEKKAPLKKKPAQESPAVSLDEIEKEIAKKLKAEGLSLDEIREILAKWRAEQEQEALKKEKVRREKAKNTKLGESIDREQEIVMKLEAILWELDESGASSDEMDKVKLELTRAMERLEQRKKELEKLRRIEQEEYEKLRRSQEIRRHAEELDSQKTLEQAREMEAFELQQRELESLRRLERAKLDLEAQQRLDRNAAKIKELGAELKAKGVPEAEVKEILGKKLDALREKELARQKDRVQRSEQQVAIEEVVKRMLDAGATPEQVQIVLDSFEKRAKEADLKRLKQKELEARKAKELEELEKKRRDAIRKGSVR